MPVLQPSISTATKSTGANVGVSEGIIGTSVNVSGGVSVSVGLGVVPIPLVVGVSETRMGKVGGGIITGVAVKMPGVREGIGVHTWKGCGGAPQVSQADSNIVKTSKINDIFFIMAIIPAHFYWIIF